MQKKTKYRFGQISNAVLLAGLIILAIGLYYAVLKAGIPYQDPTVEMQIQYAVNHEIGGVLSTVGVTLVLCGGIVRFIMGRVARDLRDTAEG